MHFTLKQNPLRHEHLHEFVDRVAQHLGKEKRLFSASPA
jgi:hypothetical protein